MKRLRHMAWRRRRWPVGMVSRTGAWLAALAAAVAAGKMALFAVGSGSFLADRPADELAWVYLGLAVIAAAAALALAPWLERTRPARAMARLLAAAGTLAVVATAALACAWPGGPMALLILAHLYNIATEIMFWLVASSWLPAPDLRAATLWISLATALGGFLGGVAVESLLPAGAPTTLAAAAGVAVVSAFACLAFGERGVQAGQSQAATVEAPVSSAAEPGGGWSVFFAHPLGPPLGAASFLLTLVWVLTEYLCLANYQLLYRDPELLARRLALIFAVLQLLEFLCILLFTGPATRWLPPAWRSTLFPAGALFTLLLMGRSSSAPWSVVLAHAYTEAASNAVFDPVHASNFAAAPARLQTRLRSAADGICYPFGMAAGGAVLLAVHPAPDPAALERVLLIATIAAMLFLGVGVFTGSLIGPSLLTALGLTPDIGVPATRLELRAARHRLAPWARRSRLRHKLSATVTQGRQHLRERIDRADRRALRAVFEQARRCQRDGPLGRLEVLLDSRSPETRALAVEAVVSLPCRRLFLPFLPALRRRYQL